MHKIEESIKERYQSNNSRLSLSTVTKIETMIVPNVISNSNQRSYSTEKPYFVPFPAKNPPKDAILGHINTIEHICIISDCKDQNCSSLCDKITGTKITGNLTHTPPSNSHAELLSHTDVTGIEKNQYRIPNTTSSVIEKDYLSSSDTDAYYSPTADEYLQKNYRKK